MRLSSSVLEDNLQCCQFINEVLQGSKPCLVLPQGEKPNPEVVLKLPESSPISSVAQLKHWISGKCMLAHSSFYLLLFFYVGRDSVNVSRVTLKLSNVKVIIYFFPSVKMLHCSMVCSFVLLLICVIERKGNLLSRHERWVS
jgi:hypothetical protein